MGLQQKRTSASVTEAGRRATEAGVTSLSRRMTCVARRLWDTPGHGERSRPGAPGALASYLDTSVRAAPLGSLQSTSSTSSRRGACGALFSMVWRGKGAHGVGHARARTAWQARGRTCTRSWAVVVDACRLS